MSIKNIVFAGTPSFSAHILLGLIEKKYNISLVLTRPDRRQGRGMKLTPSEVKKVAQENNIPTIEPLSLKNKELFNVIKDIKPDIMIVVAYGLIIPKDILLFPKYGCINIHASILPRWRGAAPIQRAIEAGDKISGITIIQMDEGLDTGDILLTRECEIFSHFNAGHLHDELMKLGLLAVIEVIDNYESFKPIKQSLLGIKYAHKITKEEAYINWNDYRYNIINKIRAFNPSPGAWSILNGKVVKIWNAKIIDIVIEDIKPVGSIFAVDKSIVVNTKDGFIEILELQLSGRVKMRSEDFLSGYSFDNNVLGNN